MSQKQGRVVMRMKRSTRTKSGGGAYGRNSIFGNDALGNTYNMANDYGTVDAQNNWWGSNDEDVITSHLAGNVDYDPWLPSAP